MAGRQNERYGSEHYRGDSGASSRERGFDPRVSSDIRTEFDEEQATRRREAGIAEHRRAQQAERLYERDYGPYDYGWGSERPGVEWTHPRERLRGPFAGRGPKGYQRSDARIREDVCDRLADAPFIDASDIEVVVKEGEVTLSGTVANREQKRRSEDVIDTVPGVKDVQNRLRVSRTAGGTYDGT